MLGGRGGSGGGEESYWEIRRKEGDDGGRDGETEE